MSNVITLLLFLITTVVFAKEECTQYRLTASEIIFSTLDNPIEIPKGSILEVRSHEIQGVVEVKVKGPDWWENSLENGVTLLNENKLPFHTCIKSKKPARKNDDECSQRKTNNKSINNIPPNTIINIYNKKNTPSWANNVAFIKDGKIIELLISKKIISENSSCIEFSDECAYRVITKETTNLAPYNLVEIISIEPNYYSIEYTDSKNIRVSSKIGKDQLKNNSICFDPDVNKNIKLLAPTSDCDDIKTSTNLISANQTPPPSSSNDLYFGTYKSSKELEQYFSCYRKVEEDGVDDTIHHKNYMSKYKTSIDRTINKFSEVNNFEFNSEEIKPIFKCLVMRESTQWSGVTSPTGAVGLAQFTNIAIDHVEGIFKAPETKISKINEHIDYLEGYAKRKGKLTQTLRRDYNTAKAMRAKFYRYEKIKNFYRQLRKDNPKLPNLDVSDSKIDAKITKSVLKNNDNHEFIFALAMSKMMDCTEQLKPYFKDIKDNSMSKLFFACTIAHNIGISGFESAAMGKNKDTDVSDWIKNLDDSDYFQRKETINHIISIQRCFEGNTNYPQCGSDAGRCVKRDKSIKNTNHCNDARSFMCYEYDKKTEKKVKEKCD